MKKIALMLGLLGLSALANAADPLNGTVWKTIDDKTNQPKAIVKFTEQSNGTLSASIQKVLTKGEENDPAVQNITVLFRSIFMLS
jgi:copper homeostasis protein CutC